MKSSSSG